MAGETETETINLQPLGQGGNEIEEISETISVVPDRDANYEARGRWWNLRFRPRTADEASALQRGHDDLGHRKLVTWAGLILLFIVTLASVATFLGLPGMAGWRAYDDAVKFLYLIVGAVVGYVFGSGPGAKKDGP